MQEKRQKNQESGRSVQGIVVVNDLSLSVTFLIRGLENIKFPKAFWNFACGRLEGTSSPVCIIGSGILAVEMIMFFPMQDGSSEASRIEQRRKACLRWDEDEYLTSCSS